MRLDRIVLATIAMGTVAVAQVAQGAEPAVAPAPIRGSDVMGDRNRTGPDGFSWAPQPRDQAPADDSHKTAASGLGNNHLGPDSGTKLAPGDDPGTPAAGQAHGPGTIDAGAVHKP